jgi:hypothetical protein
MKQPEEDRGFLYLVVGQVLLAVLFLFITSPVYADNQISIEQSGNDFSLTVDQTGANNTVKLLDTNSYINMSSLDLIIKQINNTSVSNQVVIDEMSGSNNQVRICQGCAWSSMGSTTDHSTTYDNIEGGGHYVEIDLYGSGNRVSGHQTNQGSTSGHNFELHLAGDDNDVQWRQQSDGAKNIDLTIYNDENEVLLRQKGNGANHTMTIELDGTYGTSLELIQLGTTTQSYTLQQNCLTVGVCSVTITQQ